MRERAFVRGIRGGQNEEMCAGGGSCSEEKRLRWVVCMYGESKRKSKSVCV